MATRTRVAISRKARECFATIEASNESPYIVQVMIGCAIECIEDIIGGSIGISSKGNAIGVIVKNRALISARYNMAVKTDTVTLSIKVCSF
ncbi:MAG: hypothetical protein GW873_07430 [Nitrospirae bacterium]|nr:hypothetical protein [Nitrospirota bacterium]